MKYDRTEREMLKLIAVETRSVHDVYTVRFDPSDIVNFKAHEAECFCGMQHA